ncbi:MAG: transposase [Paraglaciecola sp.]|jgi:transposase
MFSASNQRNVTLVCGPTDMRKAIDGLSNIVAYEFLQEPCSEQLFVFCGRRRDRLKILQWVNNGFWLHYKRLEKGTFHWPGIDDKQLGLTISARQLNWLLEGLPLQQDHAHPHLRYRYHDC